MPKWTKSKTVKTSARTEVALDRLRAMRDQRGCDSRVSTVASEAFSRGVELLLEEELAKASAQAAA